MYLKFEGVIVYSEELESVNDEWLNSMVSYLQKYIGLKTGKLTAKLPFAGGFMIMPDPASVRPNEKNEYHVDGTFIFPGGRGWDLSIIGHMPSSNSSTIDWMVRDFPDEEFNEVLYFYSGKNKIKGELFSLPDVQIEIQLKEPFDLQEESVIMDLVKNFCNERKYYCIDSFQPNDSHTKGLHLDYVNDPSEIRKLISELAGNPKWSEKIDSVIIS